MSLLAKENISNNYETSFTSITDSDNVCSSYIDFQNPQYAIIDGLYSSSILIVNYSREMESLFLDRILSLDIDCNISMFYHKKNSYEVIKEITYTIGNVGADIKTSYENQQDMDVVGSVYGDAKYIRKQLQIGDEQLFYLSLQITAYAKSKELLEMDLERLESVVVSCGLTSIRANFRQEQALKTALPFNQIDEDIFKLTRRNVLTSGLCSTYPFASNVLFDKSGVLVGTNSFDKTVLMLDRFETNKYKNANMFVVGTSGSGKSYFVKLMINRNRFIGVNQFVIDPDREYIKLCESLDGTLINFGANQVINVFDIRPYATDENESYLLSKISKLKVFFSMIFEKMLEEDRALLEDALIKLYANFGITQDNNSLLAEDDNSKLIKKKRFKTSTQMPKFSDFYDLVKKDKKLKKYANQLKPFITGSLKYLDNYTNVDTSNKLVVVDVHEAQEDDLPLIMFVVTEYFWDVIKQNRALKKLLYLDEVWKLINKNEYTADFVFKLFKTIRKYGGGATAITQDISDFFMLDDGKYGKGILNNSSVKAIFQLEETDINILEKVINISEEEKYRLINMKRGTSIIHADRNVVMVDIVASKKEHERITTDRQDLQKQMEVI